MQCVGICMIICSCPSPLLDSKPQEEGGAGSVLFSLWEKVVWPKINAQQQCAECVNEYMNLKSIPFCSPVWLKWKSGNNRLGQTVRLWEEATGRGLVLTLRTWVGGHA